MSLRERVMALDTRQKRALMTRLTSAAPSFDLLALLRALEHLDFGPSDLFFKNDPEDAPTRSLISRVEFREMPTRHVILTLNMGLLGPNSPLPSYFLRLLEEVPDRESYLQFMGFFNHLCIKNLLSSIHPDYFGRFYENWSEVRRSYLGICGLSSLDRVYWLFTQLIPELPLTITRAQFQQSGDYQAARTGITRLDGTGIMGRAYQAEAEGFLIKLYAEYEHDSRGRSWPRLIETRFRENIQPLLASHGVEVALSLSIAEHTSWAKLTHSGFLGYDRLRQPQAGAHEVVIYDGRISSRARPAL